MAETLKLQSPSTAELKPAGVADEHMALVGQATQSADTLQLTGQPNPEAVQQLGLQVAEGAGDIAIGTEVIQPPVAKVQELIKDREPVDIEYLERNIGLTTEQAEGAVANGEAMQPHKRVAIHLPRFALADMFRPGGGRYKTKYETGKTLGGTLSSSNKEAELGIGPIDGEQHPIYGFLTDQTEIEHGKIISGLHDNYGQAVIVLKPEVAERATYTDGDSINGGATKDSLMGVRDASIVAEARRIANHSPSRDGRREFVEAQIQGGVRAEDVESLTITVRKESDKAPHHTLPEGEKGWFGIESIEETIAEFQELAPDLPLTFRIPEGIDPIKSGVVTKEIVELAAKHPNVKFVVVMKAYSPFKEQNSRKKLLDEGDTISEERIKDSTRTHRVVAEERDKYKQLVLDYWKSQHGDDSEPPTNLEIILSNHGV